jgi:heme A synthase
MDISLLSRFSELLTAAVSVAIALASILVAMRAGFLKRVRFGGFEFEGTERETKATQQVVDEALRGVDTLPFESEQLARYYSQVLSQSRVSFWFSLIFASLGFAVIIGAAMLYSDKRNGSTIASFLAGVIIDAVAALFFVQSREAQKAMAEFFNKLRTDRESLESRKLCEIIGDPRAKDALRIHLALHLAGVSDHRAIADSIVSTIAGVAESVATQIAEDNAADG